MSFQIQTCLQQQRHPHSRAVYNFKAKGRDGGGIGGATGTCPRPPDFLIENFFEMVVDSETVVRISKERSLYALPSFPQW